MIKAEENSKSRFPSDVDDTNLALIEHLEQMNEKTFEEAKAQR